jgi:hypothetical protein
VTRAKPDCLDRRDLPVLAAMWARSALWDLPARRERPGKRVRRGHRDRKDRRELAAKQDCPAPQDLKGLWAKKVRLVHPDRRAFVEKRDRPVLLDHPVSRAYAPST